MSEVAVAVQKGGCAMVWKEGESPYETVVRKLREAHEEAEILVEALGRSLKEQPNEVPGTWTWLDLVLRLRPARE